MKLLEKSSKPLRSKPNTLSISSLLDKKTHLKPFSNISEIPIDELYNYNKSKLPPELYEADIIEDTHMYLSSPRYDQILPQKTSPEQEEIKNLHEYINLLKRQLSDSQAPSRQSHYEAPRSRKSESVGDLRMLAILENENKKLKNKLQAAETSVERLYNEIKILNEQLLIYQKRCERGSEKSEPNSAVSTEDQCQNYGMYVSKKIIKRVEGEIAARYQELASKIESDEKRLEKIISRQFKIKEQCFGKSDEYVKLLKANKIMQKQIESQDPRNGKVKEYEKEIFKLGNTVFKTQEKYDKCRAESQKTITKLLNENSQLKELLISSEKSLQHREGVQKVTSPKELRQISLQTSKKPMHYPEKYVSLHSGKPSEDAKLRDEYNEKLECIAEEYEIKLEKICRELQESQESYISLEDLLLKTQETLNSSEEAYSFLKTNHNQVVGALKRELEAANCELHENKGKLKKLLAINNSVQGEATEDSKVDLVKRYNKVLLELRTNKQLVEEYQKEIAGHRKTIEDQKLLISSLESEVCPQDSGEEFMQNDEYHVDSFMPASYSSDEINGKPEKSKIKTKRTLEKGEKKDQIIEELRKQVATVTLDYEKLLQELRKCNELYTSSREECIELEKVIEALEFDISILKSQ